MIAWLSVVTWYIAHEHSTSESAVQAVTSTTVTLPLSAEACSGRNTIPAGIPTSFNSSDGGIILGAGTSVYTEAQHHDYGSYVPNHLSVVSIVDDIVLLGLGKFIVVGDGSGDWVTGQSFPFNVSSSAPAVPGWGQFFELPLFVDEIVLLSCNNGVAFLAAVGGGGVIPLQVDTLFKTVIIGNHTSFVSGDSVDTDTAAIGPSSFAISYYMDGSDGAILLMTISGSISNQLVVTFGKPVNYSPNHMFHQILALGPHLYALSFPNDDASGNSVASPMGILIASVDSSNQVTIWSADGHGLPWLQTYVLGYYFFDLTLVDLVYEADGLTATGAMAVVNRAVADAITIVTFKISASGDAQRGYSDVSCVYSNQLTATQAGATIGYNYFAMQPLFSLPVAISSTHHQRTIKGSSALSSAGTHDFAITWQDTTKQGAVEAVVVSYAVESGRLSMVMESTQIAPPIGANAGHWWIAGDALPHGRMMILTTLDNKGNITIVEHLGQVVGLVSSAISCADSPKWIDVTVNGHVKLGSAQHEAVSDPTVWATSRGNLVFGTSAWTPQGSYGTLVGEDGCVGLREATDGGVWISPSVC